MLLALPSAQYGNKQGAWEWGKPFTAYRRGAEIDTAFEGPPPHTRVIHLNMVTMGDALERALQEGASEEWIFTLVDWQGAQHLWAGTGLEATRAPGGKVPKGGKKVISVSVWTKAFTARLKRVRVTSADAASSPSPSPSPPLPPSIVTTTVPPLNVVPVGGGFTCPARVAYLRGVKEAIMNIVCNEGCTQRAASQPTQYVITREKCCEELERVFTDYCEQLYFGNGAQE